MRYLQALNQKRMRERRIANGLCTNCGIINNTKFKMCNPCREKMKNYRSRSKEVLRLYQQNLHLDRKSHGLCTRCGKPRDIEIQICSACKEHLRLYNHERRNNTSSYKRSMRDYFRKRTNQAKNKLFIILGSSSCICEEIDCWHIGRCGVSDIRCIQFDHVEGGGNKTRKQRSRDGQKIRGNTYFEWYANHPEIAKAELQVFCANCNWTKRVRLDECMNRPEKNL